MASYPYLFKFIIIGDTGVGKSCLLLQFIDGRFRQKHEVTIGVEFGARMVQVGDKNVKLQIWDTAGQESFKSITRGYYRSAACALLVYDVTNRDSFANVLKWLEEAKLNGNPTLSFTLIGNKCDLEAERKVSLEEGTRLAGEHGMSFFECSSKTGYNVKQVFVRSGEVVMEKIKSGELDPNNPNSGVKANAGQSLGSVKLAPQKPHEQASSRCSC